MLWIIVLVILILWNNWEKVNSYSPNSKRQEGLCNVRLLQPYDISPYNYTNEVAFRRYARYDPQYFSYDMKECYLSTHHNGHIGRGFGNDNWDSHRFTLEYAGNDLYFIKSVPLNMYLYIDPMGYDVRTGVMPTCGQHSVDKFKWSIQTDHMDRTVVRNPAVGNRFLALSCRDGNAYSRLNYTNDTIFRMTQP